MSDEHKPGGGQESPRRFRLGRKVKPDPSIMTREEKEMKALEQEEDDAQKGTPEENASLGRGCMSCLNVLGLLLLIMLFSVIATWFVRR